MDAQRETVRAAARTFEQAIPARQRKTLGQYFTGLPLGKILAHLAMNPNVRTVLDPMAGTGDLLDATWEAAVERGITIERLDGVEIDETTAQACQTRLACIVETKTAPVSHIIGGDAFDPASIAALPELTYDLVITNPPYVRYQGQTEDGRGGRVRAGLKTIIARRWSGVEAKIWNALVDGYSGLADLSVPAWLLSAILVRPGGALALVVPATWRSRDYADVVRYLMLRCFSLECIIADQHPGWFSDALIRTHLIIARRLATEDLIKPLSVRKTLSPPVWAQIAPRASENGSLIGAAFPGACSEAEFASWLHSEHQDVRHGIKIQSFDLESERIRLEQRIRRRLWYRKIDGGTANLPLFEGAQIDAIILPEALSSVFPTTTRLAALLSLTDAGLAVGQGLRTGCNGFFYVNVYDGGPCGDLFTSEEERVLTDHLDSSPVFDESWIEASPLFGASRFAVPNNALTPVLHRQSELVCLEGGRQPKSRALNLRAWILPEDQVIVLKAKSAYVAYREKLPQVMPDHLADYVRKAAQTIVAGKLIPELSAVRTNERRKFDGRSMPRFWYMLPDFAPRHRPAAFVPRVNHNQPWIEANLDPPILVDANFSTFWAPNGGWSRYSIKALLNSLWCRAAMEALGTPLGGGALKLEATHLRHLPVPDLSEGNKAELDALGKRLVKDDSTIQMEVDKIILGTIIAGISSPPPLGILVEAIESRLSLLVATRRRGRRDC